MAQDVRATRRYDSPRRRAQAAATRADILGAAQRLFERQGYAATTMEAIAVEAGVALKTVYVAFETKSGLLRALWNHLLRAGRDETPVAEQEWYREMLEEPDAERQLRLLARNARVVKLRIGGVLEVIRSAAPVDAEIGALWSRIEQDFLANQRAVAQSLDDKRALRPGSTPTPPPTSSGRSISPTHGTCWWPSAAGPPTGSSAGSATSPARSSSTADRTA